MNKSIWQRILQLGVTKGEETDFRLERRIILSNQLAIIISVLTVVFMIIFSGRPEFSVTPFIVLLLITSSILGLNYVGLTKLSRMVTCLTPVLGIIFLNLSQKLEDPGMVDILNYATPRMLMLGSAIIPFTMFTTAERKYVFTGVGLVFLLAFGYDLIHQWAGVDYKTLGIETEHYSIIYEDLIVLALIILLSCGFMLRMSGQYDDQSHKMLQDALDQTSQLKANEEAMQITLKELEQSRKKDEERNWVSKGLAEMIAILQSGDDMERIFDKLISKLIIYCDLNQGALFIAEENQSNQMVLKLISCYAYHRKKHIEIEVGQGEGLLGQVYLEGERCYLKKIPADYLKITSGLGESTPTQLVILPMKVNNKVEGILELASFTSFESKHFELLEQLGENLASFIANNRVNRKTKELLQQSQTMSAEMRENEEEMRQNLEELQATQEALARKEKEYQDRIHDLEEELKATKALAYNTTK